MGLATSLLSGDKGEWALTKRHRSETNFGIQVCGSKVRPVSGRVLACQLRPDFASPYPQPQQLVTAAEAIVQQCDNVDFVDVNLGCPIDLVFNKGAGSALFDSVRDGSRADERLELTLTRSPPISLESSARF